MQELYYLHHLRSCAAATHGSRGATRGPSHYAGLSVFGWLEGVLCGVLYGVMILGLRAACDVMAAYCVQDALWQCGMGCPWEASVAMVSGHPIAFLACTQAFAQWPRQDVPMVVSMLLCMGWHAPTKWDCCVVSAAAAMALTPSRDVHTCLLMLVAGALFPAFPPSDGEGDVEPVDAASGSEASQESWWQDLDDDDGVADDVVDSWHPAEQDDADLRRAMQESLKTTSDRHAALLAEVGDRRLARARGKAWTQNASAD